MFDASLLLAALTLGLSGSVHCALMCGPLAAFATSAPAKRSVKPRYVSQLPIIADTLVQASGHTPWLRVVSYHLARAAGYIAVGAAFGALGQALDLSAGVTVSTLLPYLLVTFLVMELLGVRLPRLRLPTAQGQPVTAHTATPGWSVIVGGMTALIPCGLLYTSVPLAAGSGSWWMGASVMAAFATGTAPALVAVSLLPSAIGPWMKRARPLLLGLTILLILSRAWLMQPRPAAQATATMVCH